MPGLSAKGKTNQWMTRQDKFAYILQMMRELDQDRMRAMRVEIRLSCILRLGWLEGVLDPQAHGVATSSVHPEMTQRGSFGIHTGSSESFE